jgi:type I restriction enzyme M protein
VKTFHNARMPNSTDLLGLSDVARLAGVRPSAVANWRDRYKDFPAPAANSGAGPAFQRDDIVSWLERNRPDQAKRVKPLGIEAQLWRGADALRNNMDAAEYKHVVLGLVFLKYISDSFEERREEVSRLVRDGAPEYAGDELALEDRDEYVSKGVFWVPEESRWPRLRDQAKLPTIGKAIDDAMVAIERDNPRLKGVLPKDYARPALDPHRLGELVDLITNLGVGGKDAQDHDVLGRVYEYFLAQFASAEGKKGGQFYTPRSVVMLLVEMLEPYKGRVFDPCCGSGGMFVQSVKFTEAHGGRRNDISIFGQESNATTWRLAAMNLAIRGIEANLGPEWGDSFRRDLHPDLKADFILANPPFNDSHWNGELLRDDVRWKFGAPPVGNANFAWVQHFIYHLSPRGYAGFVLANGSLSSQQSGEGEIRKRIVEGDLVDCIVALPGQLFYSTPIAVSLWFFARDKSGADGRRDRRGEILFIDAREVGHLVDRTHRDLDDRDIAKVVDAYHAWRGESEAPAYNDLPGFCASAQLDRIVAQDYVLTPGRFVAPLQNEGQDDDIHATIIELTTRLNVQFGEASRLQSEVLKQLGQVHAGAE